MSDNKKYISRQDFHNGKEFASISGDIDFCLTLIKRLISFNSECRAIVVAKLKDETHLIDYRFCQFGYYENILKGIYYECYSLKHIYEISTFMNYKEIENTIGDTLENQRRFITFNAIIRLFSIFEFGRKEFEGEGKVENYLKKIEAKHPSLCKSLILLFDFRNTIHHNGIYKKDKDLVYYIRGGKQIIKKGEVFKYDELLLYKIIKDCLELHKLLALTKEALSIRKTFHKINGQHLVAVKTNLSSECLGKLFNS